MSDRTPFLKENIRREMLRKRSELPRSSVESAAHCLQDFLGTLFHSEQIRQPLPSRNELTVMSYMSFRKEFPTRRFNEYLLSLGIRLLLPLTDRDFIIHAFAVDDLSDLKISAMGIAEPDPQKCRAASCEEPDLIIVPGVAFDRTGGRIVFGKGCYDRFLAGRKRPVTLAGAAYAFQVTDFSLPKAPNDIPMDLIVTENGILRCKK